MSGEPLATARRYRSGMRRQFGALFHVLGLSLLLRRMRLEDHSAEEIRRAAERGPIVYVLHTRSVLDWLALNRALNGRRLPLAKFTNGRRSTVWAPLRVALREWWDAFKTRTKHGALPDPMETGWLTNVVAAGMPTALFLLAGRSIRSSIKRERNRPDHFDPIPALLDAQRKSAEPIQLIPVVVAWQRRPEVARTQVGQFIMGSQDEPGPLQKLASVGARNTKAVVQAGKPVDLREVLERFQDETQTRQTRKLRLLLRRYLWREAHLIRGPRIRPHRWTRRLVARSPEVRAMIAEESARTGRSVQSLRIEVDSILEQIAARMRISTVRILALILQFLWNRIYSGVDLPAEDMRRLRDSFRDATPVLIPCHRSHLDYLLISSQLFDRDMVIPHVVAGENLNFWPLGPIFRHCGAFFIKRSFGDDRVFPVVFQRYLHQLVRDGFPIMFFIEGGRSRTGKLMPARLGVLKMIMNSAQHLREGWDINLVPIGISYEQIAEERVYRKELQGADKKPENVSQVVKAGSIFRRRFGPVYVRVGDPIRLSEVMSASPTPFDDLGHEERQEVLQRTGEQVMHGIAKNMVAMPTGLVGLALLAQSSNSIHRTALNERIHRLFGALCTAKAPIAYSLNAPEWTPTETLKRFESSKLITRLEVGQEPIIRINPDRRITLEYYKNSVLHHVAPMSMMAAAIRSMRGAFESHPQLPMDSEAAQEIRRLFAEQVFLLRYEFTTDPEHDVDTLGAAALDQLHEYGAIQIENGALAVGEKAHIVELAELTRNLLESSLLALRGVVALQHRDLTVKTMGKALQELGQTMLDAEQIRRPESLSLVNLNNAVRALRDEGILRFRTDGSGLEVDEFYREAHDADLAHLLA
ncbi:MAG: 1-acyl-sn-glycerol-3-phosphate acyltransferase [Myxococcota bacterium]|nr:1-acyl-sn-glycerol-3-phosphate acyltransferase [Myxococcota bacterium]